MSPPPRSAAPAACLVALLAAGCHLIDQRDFDPHAGERPKPPVVAAKPAPSVPPLVTIRFDRPDPPYEPALQRAVRAALARKPDVLFTVQTVVPQAATPEAQVTAEARGAALGRQVARSIVADGASQAQLEMTVESDAAVRVPEVRVRVR